MAKSKNLEKLAADKDANVRTVVDVTKITDPQKVRKMMANARRLKNDEAYWTFFKHLCELEGKEHEGIIQKAFYQFLTAYEEFLFEKNGKRNGAQRVRRMIKNKGVVQSVEEMALRKKPTLGFVTLMQHNLPELTLERVVLDYPEYFSEEAAQKAKERLESYVHSPAFSEIKDAARFGDH